MSDLTQVLLLCLTASRGLLATLTAGLNLANLLHFRSQAVESLGEMSRILAADVPGLYDESDTESVEQISARMTEELAKVPAADLGAVDETLLAVICCASVFLPEAKAETYLTYVKAAARARGDLLRNLIEYRHHLFAHRTFRLAPARMKQQGVAQATELHLAMERHRIATAKIFHGLISALAQKVYNRG